MWYPIRDFTLSEAKLFLRKDFAKVVKRTKYLYVETKPRENIGYGFFEPILLCLCWCDFLGALYTGDGRGVRDGGIGNKKRSEVFINEVLTAVNSNYGNVSDDLIKVYRNGTVHAYAPAGVFDIRVSDANQHLKINRGVLTISIEHLLDDMMKAIEYFAKILHRDSKSLNKGSLAAFNKGRRELELK